MQINRTASRLRAALLVALAVSLVSVFSVEIFAQAKGKPRVLYVTQSKGFRHAVLHQSDTFGDE